MPRWRTNLNALQPVRKELGLRLDQQREQLDQTLAEQRQELGLRLDEERTRTLNERFATAADRLGADKPAAVRLAAVYAMAGLADDWPENCQTCIDVLCAYLRMPYEADSGKDAPAGKRLQFRADQLVRHTVIRVITSHLRVGAGTSWQDRNFDFTGVVFDGGDFSNAEFSGGTVDFSNAEFSGGTVEFSNARFAGGTVDFGGELLFSSRLGRLVPASFSGGTVNFSHAQFSGGTVNFSGASFSGGTVDFYAEFSSGTVDLSEPRDWSTPPTFCSWDIHHTGCCCRAAGYRHSPRRALADFAS